MLKNTLDTLDGVSDITKTLYTVDGAGKFQLGDEYRGEDVSGLKTALQSQKDAKTLANKEAEKLREQAEKAALKIAELENNQEEIDRIKQASLDKQKAVNDAENKRKDDIIHNLTVGSAMSRVAGQVYNSTFGLNLNELMGDNIKVAENGIDVVFTNALGETVNESDLVELLRGDERMQHLIKGSQASGGGNEQQSSSQSNVTNKSFAEMNIAEKKASLKSKNKNLR